MQFRLEVYVDNGALNPDQREALRSGEVIAQVLRKLAEKAGLGQAHDRGFVHDADGECVAFWTLESSGLPG